MNDRYLTKKQRINRFKKDKILFVKKAKAEKKRIKKFNNEFQLIYITRNNRVIPTEKELKIYNSIYLNKFI